MIDSNNKFKNYIWYKYPENKPEDYTFILVTLKSPLSKWVEIAGYYKNDFLMLIPGNKETIITHFMLLPEPAD